MSWWPLKFRGDREGYEWGPPQKEEKDKMLRNRHAGSQLDWKGLLL